MELHELEMGGVSRYARRYRLATRLTLIIVKPDTVIKWHRE
jgi:hypothetical protein